MKKLSKYPNSEIKTEAIRFISNHLLKSQEKYYIVQLLHLKESMLNGLKRISQYCKLIPKYEEKLQLLKDECHKIKVEALEKYKLYKEIKYIDSPHSYILPQSIENSSGNTLYKSYIVNMNYTKEISLSFTGNCILLIFR